MKLYKLYRCLIYMFMVKIISEFFMFDNNRTKYTLLPIIKTYFNSIEN